MLLGRRWASRLIWRDEGRRDGRKRRRERRRRGGNNLCWLTSPCWPCRRGRGSLHLPQIISLTHTLKCGCTHTFPNGKKKRKKKGLMIFQHLHNQPETLQFLQEPRHASVCVFVCVSHFEDRVCVCVCTCLCIMWVCVMSGAPYVPHKFVFTPKKAYPYAY